MLRLPKNDTAPATYNCAMDQIIYTLAVNAIPFLLAITLHEAAHGYAARALGDPTPGYARRVSMNPFNHFDLIGTLVLPLISIVTIAAVGASGFALVLGWAKPTPIDPGNFRDPKRDFTLVLAAGMVANFVMAVGWALVFRATDAQAIQAVAFAGMLWNVGLFVLHLIPIPPLTAGMALASILPTHLAARYLQVMRYSFFIILALAITGILAAVLRPAYSFGMNFLALVAGR
jgi:Zn-dependent protease